MWKRKFGLISLLILLINFYLQLTINKNRLILYIFDSFLKIQVIWIIARPKTSIGLAIIKVVSKKLEAKICKDWLLLVSSIITRPRILAISNSSK